jgi:6-phosphofructokinase
MKTQKRLGILTSGGDCPGLNAVIRAVVSHARLTYNWQVLGIPYATKGLLERKTVPLSLHSLDLRGIDPLLNMGGTILGSINKLQYGSDKTIIPCREALFEAFLQVNFCTKNPELNRIVIYSTQFNSPAF